MIRFLPVLTVALVLAGCGGDDPPTVSATESRTQERRAHIEQLIRDGHLPPIARGLISADGAMNLDLIDGPKFAKDVVRTSADGSRGKKLQWA
jgi:hypothetical protein